MVKFWPWYIIITQIKTCTETSDNAYMQDFASSLMHDWLQSASESKKCQLFPPFLKFPHQFPIYQRFPNRGKMITTIQYFWQKIFNGKTMTMQWHWGVRKISLSLRIFLAKTAKSHNPWAILSDAASNE